jgi:hypothetical protein
MEALAQASSGSSGGGAYHGGVGRAEDSTGVAAARGPRDYAGGDAAAAGDRAASGAGAPTATTQSTAALDDAGRIVVHVHNYFASPGRP